MKIDKHEMVRNKKVRAQRAPAGTKISLAINLGTSSLLGIT